MMLLEETPPSEANALLNAAEPGGNPAPSCSHWLLDTSSGGLRPEDEDPCPKCLKTWGTLLLDCLGSEGLTANTASAVPRGNQSLTISFTGPLKSAPLQLFPSEPCGQHGYQGLRSSPLHHQPSRPPGRPKEYGGVQLQGGPLGLSPDLPLSSTVCTVSLAKGCR